LLFEYLIYAGLVLTALGLLGVLWLAFRRGVRTGLAVLLVPPLIPWGVVKTWPRSRIPACLLSLGLVALAVPPIYTRFGPIDLGPRIKQAGGEKHITLTGWDRPASEYRGLEAHPDCVVLQMANADVDDRVLSHLAGMEQLRELDLDNTQIGDAGLAIVARLPALERLRLSRTRVSDAGFAAHLANHPRLRQLWCPGTAIGRPALEAWKQAGTGRRYLTDAPAVDSTTGPNDPSTAPSTPAPEAPGTPTPSEPAAAALPAQEAP
jgi:hypothetical protein